MRVRSHPLKLNCLNLTYQTYREQLITEVCEELLFLRVVHVGRFETAFGDEGAVDGRGTFQVVEAVSVDDPIVDLVDAGHLVRGVLALADRHHVGNSGVQSHFFECHLFFEHSLICSS